MDHGDMGHGDMGHGHGDMGGAQCSMNMLFTWNTENLCIVFPQWRVTSTMSLLFSLVGVALLTAAYEWVRSIARKYDASSAEYINSLPLDATEGEQRSWNWLGRGNEKALQKTKMIKALLYAVQIFYSFFVMLLFMTYNGWIMISVAVGAFIGYLAFNGDTPAAKDVSCH